MARLQREADKKVDAISTSMNWALESAVDNVCDDMMTMFRNDPSLALGTHAVLKNSAFREMLSGRSKGTALDASLSEGVTPTKEKGVIRKAVKKIKDIRSKQPDVIRSVLEAVAPHRYHADNRNAGDNHGTSFPI
jgi:hypothetical protein